jgi:hypothetical protein
MARRTSSAHACHGILQDYSAAALTTGTNKREWVAPFKGRIIGVSPRAETAGSGTGSTTIDVNINGTSIFASANQPTLAVASTGEFTAGLFDSTAATFNAGDRISYDVDAIPTTTGHARFSLSISLGV